jgi:2-polyprenyl-3-methyl-5-hydroxy-6-metoxy-1,4-benzoquinol methylase
MSCKFDIQESQYVEPYHYNVTLEPFGLFRALSWGVEYASYVNGVMDVLAESKFETLLDVGCGDGFLVNSLAKIYTEQKLNGVDLSDRAIGFANAFSVSTNTTFTACDASEMGEFDVVTLIEVAEHIPPEAQGGFWDSVSNRVKSGGRLIVSVPTTNTAVHEKHFRHYTKELLEKEVGNNFVLLKTLWRYDTKSFLARRLEKILINKYFILRSKKFTRFLSRKIFAIHAKADHTNGAHLIAVFQKKA